MSTLAVMVEIDRDVAIWGLVAVAALAAVIGWAWWRARRGMVRRVMAAAFRLEDHPPAVEQRGLDKNLARLERAVDRAVLEGGNAVLTATRLASALEAIPQGVVVCDDHGEVTYRNGVAQIYIAARHGDALVGAAIGEMLAHALDDRTERRTLELFGPPRRTLIITAAPLDDERRTVGALAVIDDVSERRRLEAMRRDFVANISHELKTPVGALALLAETLLAEDDPAVTERLARRMLAEAFRVGGTIDDLLELSRIEAEEAPQREPVPFHLVVAEASGRVRPAAAQRHIELQVEEPSRRLTILGDRRQLVSALYNLLENAVKYSDDGSTVEVDTALVGSDVEVAVRDHGIGIPARDLERIFERFYRVDRARSRSTGGTGLGLAIVRHVAGNHQGEVRVRSREGEGSTFTLVLPAGPGMAALDSAAG
ncbi:two-component system sensor histidine kinase SenX3 [soil metagenome]